MHEALEHVTSVVVDDFVASKTFQAYKNMKKKIYKDLIAS